MLKGRNNRFNRLKARKDGDRPEELRLLKLEGENLELFGRLKTKLPKFSETDLINSALKCLENRTDRIISRHLAKKVKIMSDQGLKPQQIATELNERKIPATGKSKEWSLAEVIWLLDKDHHHDEQGLRTESGF